MNGLRIIESSAHTPATSLSTGSHPVTTTSNLRATAEEVLTTTLIASEMNARRDRTSESRLHRSRARRSQWAKVRDALMIEGMPATRGRAAQPSAVPSDSAGRVETPDPDGRAEIPIAPTPIVATPIAEDLAAAAPADPIPKPAGPSRVELTIDSLRSYELVKPIPVFVEALGERHYVAEVPDLNMSISASSLGDTLIVLKNSIAQNYDELRIRRSLDAEQARQLRTLESYIGKSKRGWLDRR
jgi:hypothetical protein